MMSTAEIRSLFLNYFSERGHEVVPSASLVPHNDPSLMFTNAGMVPFKNLFTGLETRAYKRAASSQKCVRAGGKHNDLDNVGYTARHHTFFEMLGNFSFGDYFKEDAIKMAWDLITRELGVDKDRLLVTVYHEDEEAYDLWGKIAGLPSQRIIKISSKAENFWSMGDVGPCGPCSEIFYDHGEGIPGGPPGSPDADGDRFVEIWNLVFMQFEQLSSGEMVTLPKPSIDTGMGIERIAAVMQGVHNNYDTDIFKSIIGVSEELTKRKAAGEFLASHRVIADHLRSISFLIADGVLPSNEGRGYVLRRIMRRAMRHGQILGFEGSLLAKLVPTLVDKMGVAYPELVRAEPLITETMNMEENRFRQTLEKGLKLLSEESESVQAGQSLPGDVAFKLYDTYGFPLDLTQDIMRTQGKLVDTDGFDAAMAKQKAEAKASWSGSGDTTDEKIWFEIKEKLGASEFLGYDSTDGHGIIQAIVVDGVQVKSAKAGESAIIITNQTPFYAESGGQSGDHGIIKCGNVAEFIVEDTVKKAGDLFLHIGKVTKGSIETSQEVEMEVDIARREGLMANHSATHLLHAALRKILGSHVVQKGSLVLDDKLRFDFSHSGPLSPDEIAKIDREVNSQIRKNAESHVKVMTPDDAQKSGALALFGEKYGDEVRVVSMGDNLEGPYSVELCGGTHCERAGDIGFFKIISESGVAAGIRRIEALTGIAAEEYARDQDAIINNLSDFLKAKGPQLLDKVKTIADDKKKLEREIQALRQQLAMGGGSSNGQEFEEISGIKYYHRHLKDVPPKDLKPMADEIKSKLQSGVIALFAENDGKVSVVISVTDDLVNRYSSVDLVKKAVEPLGGSGGGGRADMAQAGGSSPDGINEAIEIIRGSLN